MINFRKLLGKNPDWRNGEPPECDEVTPPMSASLAENIEILSALFRDDGDFTVRSFDIPINGGIGAALFFLDGLADGAMINDSILRPLMLESRRQAMPESYEISSIEDLCKKLLLAGEIEAGNTFEAACSGILVGDTVLIVDGLAEMVYINTKGFERRSISEPQTETVVRGPREGFTEVMNVNTSLIRRKIRTSHLRMDRLMVGKRTRTPVCLSYLDDVASPELVAEVKRRLKTINTDAILNGGYIEQYIEDAPSSVFQTINYSEKPDVVAAKLLEGHCALIIDGTPFVLTLPMQFIECFQSPEDYAVRTYVASFLRIIRFLAFLVSIITPAVYVALTSFHQELIPTTLLFSIAAAREGTPFNSVVEAAVMLITFEVLKEAGIRLPKPAGQAVSIVGALVMGQAAIEAGLVSASVVIAVALAAVSSFLIPTLSDVISLLRLYLLALAAIMGGYGIALGMLTILFHLASLESFGSNYLYPYSPFSLGDMKDGITRAPLWQMRTRPRMLRPKQLVRQDMQEPHFGQEEDA